MHANDRISDNKIPINVYFVIFLQKFARILKTAPKTGETTYKTHKTDFKLYARNEKSLLICLAGKLCTLLLSS